MIAQPHPQLVGSAAKADRARRSVRWLAPARVARWLSVRHSLAIEAVAVLGLYATYEPARGLVVGDRRVAVDHATDAPRRAKPAGVVVRLAGLATARARDPSPPQEELAA
jgi:hypothetical protein